MTDSKKKMINSRELRQKLYYFQNEAAKYKFLCEKYELLISKALISKRPEVEIQKEEQVQQQKENCIAYFNYSIIQEKDDPTPFIYGSFIVKNIGNVSLNNPIICLKVNHPKGTVVGGKIGEVHDSEDKLFHSFEEWSYVHEDWRGKYVETGEIWLKPKQTTEIKPGEKLSFSGFDVQFHDVAKQIIIEGFCYFQQMTDGRKSLNSISITF